MFRCGKLCNQGVSALSRTFFKTGYIAISLLAFISLLPGCSQPNNQVKKKSETVLKKEDPVEKVDSSQLIAITCSLSGTEKSLLDGMQEKSVSRQDIFIFDPNNLRLMASDYSPIDAKVDGDRIIIDKRDEEVNAVDGTGNVSEYFYGIDRSSLRATHTAKDTSNIAGIYNKSYVLMEGSCQKTELPPRAEKRSNNQI